MFNKLNFNERITVKLIVNTVLIVITFVIFLVVLNLASGNISLWLNWLILLGMLVAATIALDYYFSKWASIALKKPISDAGNSTNKATDVINKASIKYETSVNRQLELIDDIQKLIKQLSYTSENTKHSAQKVADKSNQALKISEEGQQSMHVNIKKMATLKQKIETIAEQILELSEHTQQIGSIVGVVEDITEQTNMLALNAAVEAARAGEHGRGFAVVASEIRKLADQIKQATNKITSLIYDIQQATNSTVMATEEGTKEIEAGVNLANQAAETINALRSTMQETVEAIETIVSASREQFKYASDVSSVMIAVNTGIKDSVETIEKSKNAIIILEQVTQSLNEILITNNNNIR
jgi:methyl-accepting chemotaxis protein